MCLADEHALSGWRQHAHLLKKVKKLDRKIGRIASKKGPNYRERMKPLYRELLQKVQLITQRARELCDVTGQPQPCAVDLFGANTLQAFIVRTERVADTARRRVIEGKSVANVDKLFSVFEPHTQLYKRGKAGQPIQFGRQVSLLRRRCLSRAMCSNGEGSGSSLQTAWAAGVRRRGRLHRSRRSDEPR